MQTNLLDPWRLAEIDCALRQRPKDSLPAVIRSSSSEAGGSAPRDGCYQPAPMSSATARGTSSTPRPAEAEAAPQRRSSPPLPRSRTRPSKGVAVVDETCRSIRPADRSTAESADEATNNCYSRLVSSRPDQLSRTGRSTGITRSPPLTALVNTGPIDDRRAQGDSAPRRTRDRPALGRG
jgi:hypothetical protein